MRVPCALCAKPCVADTTVRAVAVHNRDALAGDAPLQELDVSAGQVTWCAFAGCDMALHLRECLHESANQSACACCLT